MQLLQNENALLQQRILVLEAEKATLQYVVIFETYSAF